MEHIPKNNILEIASDSMEYIRKQYELDTPGTMKEAIDILQNWIDKQDHFQKKDFDIFYLETTIFGCKGSIERAKARLDKMCTLRSMLPQLFDISNLTPPLEKTSLIFLPKHTDDHYRVCAVKLNPATYTFNEIRNLWKLGIMMAEYEKVHDYVDGFIIILDLVGVNLLELLSCLNLIELKQMISVFLDGYGMRVRAIHIISESKLVDAFVTTVKQLFPNKIANRIHVNKIGNDLLNVIPKTILPRDYGGDEISIKDLQQLWTKEIFSEDHKNYIREMNKAVADESRRSRDQFMGQYAGVAGTFKLLHID